MAAGWEIESEFVAPGALPVTGATCFRLADGVIERVASTGHPQPHLATVRIRHDRADGDGLLTSRPDHDRFVLVVDQLNDPGNLGTILRSAEAAGVDAVVLTPGSVDPFNPKVVRASAGALFHVPVLTTTVDDVRDAGFRVLGTSSRHGDLHTQADWQGDVALVMGNEAHGLAEDAPVDGWVRIEHRGRAESLNVAMAATLLVFAAAERRR